MIEDSVKEVDSQGTLRKKITAGDIHELSKRGKAIIQELVALQITGASGISAYGRLGDVRNCWNTNLQGALF